jgi:hypothetical protein
VPADQRVRRKPGQRELIFGGRPLRPVFVARPFNICSRLLQIASDRQRAAAGTSLPPLDFSQENVVARQLIGEPHVSRLDATVESASNQQRCRAYLRSSWISGIDAEAE